MIEIDNKTNNEKITEDDIKLGETFKLFNGCEYHYYIIHKYTTLYFLINLSNGRYRKSTDNVYEMACFLNEVGAKKVTLLLSEV